MIIELCTCSTHLSRWGWMSRQSGGCLWSRIAGDGGRTRTSLQRRWTRSSLRTRRFERSGCSCISGQTDKEVRKKRTSVSTRWRELLRQWSNICVLVYILTRHWHAHRHNCCSLCNFLKSCFTAIFRIALVIVFLFFGDCFVLTLVYFSVQLIWL